MHLKRRLSRVDRRKLFVAIGGIFVAVAILGVQRFPGQGIHKSLAGNDKGSSSEERESYSVHKNIITTVFWVGEEADAETNGSIHNNSTVWVEDWESAFGGEDDPNDRCGYKPCSFEPKENSFYFALPFSDYNDEGTKPDSELEVVPWYDGGMEEGESILKNRWIEIMYQDKKVYAQWEDAGPFGEDDSDYVFGADRPRELRAGLDISPAVADYLGIDGRGVTSWMFVDDSEVPKGPWAEVITASGPLWQ